jgi:hypothetical protein
MEKDKDNMVVETSEVNTEVTNEPMPEMQAEENKVEYRYKGALTLTCTCGNTEIIDGDIMDGLRLPPMIITPEDKDQLKLVCGKCKTGIALKFTNVTKIKIEEVGTDEQQDTTSSSEPAVTEESGADIAEVL